MLTASAPKASVSSRSVTVGASDGPAEGFGVACGTPISLVSSMADMLYSRA